MLCCGIMSHSATSLRFCGSKMVAIPELPQFLVLTCCTGSTCSRFLHLLPLTVIQDVAIRQLANDDTRDEVSNQRHVKTFLTSFTSLVLQTAVPPEAVQQCVGQLDKLRCCCVCVFVLEASSCCMRIAGTLGQGTAADRGRYSWRELTRLAGDPFQKRNSVQKTPVKSKASFKEQGHVRSSDG